MGRRQNPRELLVGGAPEREQRFRKALAAKLVSFWRRLNHVAVFAQLVLIKDKRFLPYDELRLDPVARLAPVK